VVFGMSQHPVTYEAKETARGKPRHRARCLGPGCGWESGWTKSQPEASDLVEGHWQAVGVGG
jgi:hypothetical protein